MYHSPEGSHHTASASRRGVQNDHPGAQQPVELILSCWRATVTKAQLASRNQCHIWRRNLERAAVAKRVEETEVAQGSLRAAQRISRGDAAIF